MTSVRIAMYTHGALYVAFAITMIFFTSQLKDLNIAYYIYIVMTIILIGLYFGYRYHFLHTKRNRYTVVFSKWNNRKAWQDLLDERHLANVDITEGSFSFVSKINFTAMEQSTVNDILKDLDDNSDLVQPLNTSKALLLLAFQVFVLSLSFVSFILFFVLIPNL